jgi:hypothetical protein
MEKLNKITGIMLISTSAALAESAKRSSEANSKDLTARVLKLNGHQVAGNSFILILTDFVDNLSTRKPRRG